MDTDKDGILDIISSSYFENAYIFKGLGNGKYSDKEIIKLSDEKEIGAKGLRYTAFSIIYEDWDNDGDFDLVTNDIFNRDGLIAFMNEGTNKAPKFNPEGFHLATVSGKSINGFSLVCHDLDNDGLKDIIGEDYGSFLWYKNVGTKASPKFEDKIAFIGRIYTKEETMKIYEAKTNKFNEEPEKSTEPAWGKIHFSFGDINGDGKDDLLVGDAYRKISKGRELTVEEQKKYKDLKAKRDTLYKEMSPLNEEFSALVEKARAENKMNDFKVPEELSKKRKIYSDKLMPIMNEIRAIESELKKTEKFGRVWVYIRK